MLRLGCALLLAFVILIPVVASRYLPWWGTLLVVLAEIVLLVTSIPRLAKFGFKRLAISLFLTKSRVLRGAMVEVHAIDAVPAPARPVPDGNGGPAAEDAPADAAAADDDPPEPPRRHVRVDLTVTPLGGASRMRFWDPSDLLLVTHDAPPLDPMTGDPGPDEAATGSPRDIRLVDPDTGGEDEVEDKLTGRTRLRVVFAVPLAMTGRVKLRYYFEDVGELTLPPE